MAAIIQGDPGQLLILLQVLHAAAGYQGYVRLGFGALPERLLCDAVFHNVAQVAGTELFGTEFHFGQGGWQ